MLNQMFSIIVLTKAASSPHAHQHHHHKVKRLPFNWPLATAAASEEETTEPLYSTDDSSRYVHAQFSLNSDCHSAQLKRAVVYHRQDAMHFMPKRHIDELAPRRHDARRTIEHLLRASALCAHVFCQSIIRGGRCTHIDLAPIARLRCLRVGALFGCTWRSRYGVKWRFVASFVTHLMCNLRGVMHAMPFTRAMLQHPNNNGPIGIRSIVRSGTALHVHACCFLIAKLKGNGTVSNCQIAGPPSPWRTVAHTVAAETSRLFSAICLGPLCVCLDGCARTSWRFDGDLQKV